jgi:hypothetical protein
MKFCVCPVIPVAAFGVMNGTVLPKRHGEFGENSVTGVKFSEFSVFSVASLFY